MAHLDGVGEDNPRDAFSAWRRCEAPPENRETVLEVSPFL